MEAWRRVEVAAGEEIDGPTADDLEAIRARDVHRRGRQGARGGHRPRRRRVRRRAVSASAGPGGRWIHFGLTSSDVLDTALGAAAAGARARSSCAGARELVAALAEQAREHVDTVCVGRTHGVHAEPTTFGIKLAGFAFEAHRNAERLRARVRAGGGRRAQRRRRHLLGHEPGLRGARARAPRPRAPRTSRPRSSRATATPSCCRRSRSPAPASSASRPRSATSSAPRCARSRSRSAPGAEGLERDAAQAQPDHHRAHHRPRARAARQRAARRSRTSRCGTSATSRHSGAERVILPDSTILLDYMQALAMRVVSGLVVHADRMRANLDITHGALFSQRVLLALVASGMERDEAYRIVQEDAQRAWDTRHRRCATCSPRRDLGLDLDALFDLAQFTRHAPEIVGAPRRTDLTPRRVTTRLGSCPSTTTSSSAPAPRAACSRTA